eukprot:m.98006 g.98006  ORF g.98006 m.98006 type:complete len:400 (-) comp15064_c0_seq1:61-1260(-)
MMAEDEIFELQPCPVCSQKVDVAIITHHVNQCLEQQATDACHVSTASTKVTASNDSFAKQRQAYVALQKAKCVSSTSSHAAAKRPCSSISNGDSVAPIFKRLPDSHSTAAQSKAASIEARPAVSQSAPAIVAEPGHGGVELTALLYRACRLEQRHRRGYGAVRAIVCQNVKHYQQQGNGRRYTCGYRNTQMLLSHLLHQDMYKARLFNGSGVMPSLSSLQRMLEDAWKAGFDAVGAAQLNHHVVGTDKWIGASDVAALLRCQGIKAELVDFPSATPEQVGQWLWTYFRQHSHESDAVSHATCSPLLLQHQGHSRTVVGVQRGQHRGKPITNLLILDPAHPTQALRNDLQREGNHWQRRVKRKLATLKKSQYQILMVDGVYSDVEQRSRHIKVLTAKETI